MDISMHHARVTTPIAYLEGTEREAFIPIGPCLVEARSAAAVDIIWGKRGQISAQLPQDRFHSVRDKGHLVVLD